ncbi:Maf family protein [Rhodohalobacter halophilus]|uniref:Maf family protein n=1 Tax=Rhodohalobacter halophilus TaxID=1812810 RepID=UPI00083FC9F7|nr:Maf family protein [Rhodohalobacter halophilus]
MKIVLASASPRRAQLLKQLNLTFLVSPSNIEEVMDFSINPSELVESLAKQKGESVCEAHPDSFVIAADTIVSLHGNYLGKPETRDEATKMLSEMSGNTHNVYSGVWLAKTDQKGIPEREANFSEKTKVTFGALDPLDIERYVYGGSPMDKAGAYGIQDDFGAVFVKSIEGDYNNVVGFPLFEFYQQVKNHFPEVFKKHFNSL